MNATMLKKGFGTHLKNPNITYPSVSWQGFQPILLRQEPFL
jgi:hypothetical protein